MNAVIRATVAMATYIGVSHQYKVEGPRRPCADRLRPEPGRRASRPAQGDRSGSHGSPSTLRGHAAGGTRDGGGRGMTTIRRDARHRASARARPTQQRHVATRHAQVRAAWASARSACPRSSRRAGRGNDAPRRGRCADERLGRRWTATEGAGRATRSTSRTGRSTSTSRRSNGGDYPDARSSSRRRRASRSPTRRRSTTTREFFGEHPAAARGGAGHRARHHRDHERRGSSRR